MKKPVYRDILQILRTEKNIGLRPKESKCVLPCELRDINNSDQCEAKDFGREGYLIRNPSD